jgi:hypothetical protein
MEAAVQSREHQFTDVTVTRTKFERQVKDFAKYATNYRREGIVCLGIEFPIFEFAFLARETQFGMNLNIPVPECEKMVNTQVTIQNGIPQYLFSIRLDYSNFDTLPPSLRIINPFTSELVAEAAWTPSILPNQQDPNAALDKVFEQVTQTILLKDNQDQLFVCLRGIREYHAHPQHNGDSWFLYRTRGKGNIVSILDQLQIYAIANLNTLRDQQRKIEFKNG